MHSLNIQSVDNDCIGALKKLCADLGYKKTSLFEMAVSFYKGLISISYINVMFENERYLLSIVGDL